MSGLSKNTLFVFSLVLMQALAASSTCTPAAAENPFQRMLAPVREVTKGTSGVVSGVESVSGLKSLQEKLTTLRVTLNSLDLKLARTANQLTKIETSMAQVQQELQLMRDELQGLHEPMQKLGGPLLRVATPLAEVSTELRQLRALLVAVFLASVVIAVAVVAGIALAFFYIMFGSKQWPIRFKKPALNNSPSADSEPGQKN